MKAIRTADKNKMSLGWPKYLLTNASVFDKRPLGKPAIDEIPALTKLLDNNLKLGVSLDQPLKTEYGEDYRYSKTIEGQFLS